MYPAKNMMDYMQEINRLFPQSRENDMQSQYAPLPTYQSPSYPITIGNQSSSSADSMSPDTFPEMTPRRFETPLIPSRQRPIVGRKILGSPDQPRFNMEQAASRSVDDFDLDDTYNRTPRPNSFEPNYNKNVYYELFPEKKEFSYKPMMNPVLRSPNFVPNPTQTSSNLPYYSPMPSQFQATPPKLFTQNNQGFPPRIGTPRFPSNYPSSYGQTDKTSPGQMCTFCRKNGEASVVYMTHNVRTKVGNKSIVTCPILRSHVCGTCNATGDDAHTITYCPVLRRTNNGLRLQSTTITLKNTPMKSNGRRRY